MAQKSESSSLLLDAGKLLSSGLLTQLVALLLVTIVGRQYAQDDMGQLGLFLTWGGVLAVAAAGRYEQATVVAATPQEATSLARLSLRITTFFSLAMLPLAGGVVLTWPDNPLGYLALALPLYVFLESVFKMLQMFVLSEGRFSRLAFAQGSKGISNNLIKVLLGFVYPSAPGLISSAIGSSLLGGALLWPSYRKATRMNTPSLRETAKKYRRFPLFALPQALISMVTGSLLMMLMPLRFDIQTIGLFTMATMLADKPLHVVSAALCDTFYQRQSLQVQEGRRLLPLMHKLLFFTLIIGIPAALVLNWQMENLVVLVVGAKWRTSAEIISWMLIAIIPHFIACIWETVPDVLSKQREHAILHACLLILEAAVIGLSFFLSEGRLSRFLPLYFAGLALRYTIYGAVMWIMAYRYDSSLPVKG